MQPTQLPSNDALQQNFDIEAHLQNQPVRESTAARATEGVSDAAEKPSKRRVSFHEAIYHWVMARR